MSDLLRPSEHPLLKRYLKSVIAWHGFVRFLGMPTLQTNPDVPIDELYVTQSLSLENLPTDVEPKTEQLLDPMTLLLAKRHLVVLGDPGSGKSTLINWFSWMLAAGLSGRMPSDLQNLLPLPLVVRELKLDNVQTFEDLIRAFLDRPIAKDISGLFEVVFEYFRAGRVLLLVDGLDEVSLEQRTKLQDIFAEFFSDYSGNYSLFTSRKVGYDLAPIKTEKTVSNPAQAVILSQILKRRGLSYQKSSMNSDTSELLLCYIAPFNNEQISRFSLNWYQENTSLNELGTSLWRDDFVRSITSNSSTLQLARTPHLLTMMALIFKVKLQLPNGRALLYDLIAQAYLESIDTARKIKDPFLWQDKKRWLARIAFEMQLKRCDGELEKRKNGELLATKDDVLCWIIKAMEDAGQDDKEYNKEYASLYLDWIARRSGLLIPRGDNLFAFLHLSFQEYFAAVYIQQQIENPEYGDNTDYESLDYRFKSKPLKKWVDEIDWQQVFIFLFEIMSDKPGWLNKLWVECFDVNSFYEQTVIWSEDDDDTGFLIFRNVEPSIQLQTRLIANPHVNFGPKKLKQRALPIFELALYEQEQISEKNDIFFLDGYVMSLVDYIINSSHLLPHFCDFISSGKSLESMCFTYGVPKNIESVLLKLNANAGKLSMINCSIESLRMLNKFKGLKTLYVHGNKIEDIYPISQLCDLEELSISRNPISNIEILSSLNKLHTLDALSTRITDYSCLSENRFLKKLLCSNLTDVESILKIKSLDFLLISDAAQLKNIYPLLEMDNLLEVNLWNTGVEPSDEVHEAFFAKGINLTIL